MTQVTTTQKIEFTRAQYLNKECTHEQYYNQFVNSEIIGTVLNSISKDDIIAALQTERGLNSIPLAKWDMLANNLYNVSPKMKLAGDYLTLAGGVCIVKAAARIIAETN